MPEYFFQNNILHLWKISLWHNSTFVNSNAWILLLRKTNCISESVTFLYIRFLSRNFLQVLGCDSIVWSVHSQFQDTHSLTNYFLFRDVVQNFLCFKFKWLQITQFCDSMCNKILQKEKTVWLTGIKGICYC